MKRQNIRLPQTVSLIFIGCVLFLALHQIATAQTVHIPDSNLRALLESALNKEPGADITQVDMASLQLLQNGCHFLTLSEKGVWWVPERWICESTDDTLAYRIQDLTGLEFATHLTELHLGRNQISDISPLKNLTHLTHLDLGRNRISDVSPLKDLTNLTALSLGRNRISDISPLRDLINLTHLSLINNQVSDVSPLKNLTNLIELDLLDNQISDVSPLKDLTNLTHLSLRSNEISNISALENLTNLTYFSLRENQTSDISALKNLTNLTYLHIGFNYSISDISALTGLTKLTHLQLDHNQISDVSPLKNLTNLKHLDASDNELSDLAPLTSLAKLVWLDLDTNKKLDISALKNLTNLRHLDLHHNELSNLAPLQGLTKLALLDLEHNAISDVSPLKDLVNLKTLYLSNNHISDFSPIAGLIGNLEKYSNRNQTVLPLNADVNRDSIVDVRDLVLVALNYRNPNFARTASVNIYADVNSDGVVDIKDILAVAAEIDATAAAPTLRKNPTEISNLTVKNLKQWIQLAKQLGTQESHTQRGLTVLEQLLAILTFKETLPQETALLANYPNPFNPETWIPYQLAEPAAVHIFIYAADGRLVRTLTLGHLAAGAYRSKPRAAHWDGRNELGEAVASGVYFYTLSTESTRDSVTADDFTATRKMIIQK